MGQVVLPFSINDGDDLDAGPVMANYQAITSQINGGLQSGVNVATAAPVAQTSTGGLAEGTSAALARADHRHIIRGFEQLTADPASGNFVGRMYVNTSTATERMCIDPSGSGTWVTSANLQASDLPNHASRHATGGPDALPASSISAAMLARTGFTTATIASDVTITATSWNDVITGVSVTTTGSSGQACLFILSLGILNTSGSNSPLVNFRMLDDVPTTVWRTNGVQFGIQGGGNDQDHRTYVIPVNVTGTHVYKFQAYSTLSGMQVKKTMSTGGESGTSTKLDVLVG